MCVSASAASVALALAFSVVSAMSAGFFWGGLNDHGKRNTRVVTRIGQVAPRVGNTSDSDGHRETSSSGDSRDRFAPCSDDSGSSGGAGSDSLAASSHGASNSDGTGIHTASGNDNSSSQPAFAMLTEAVATAAALQHRAASPCCATEASVNTSCAPWRCLSRKRPRSSASGPSATCLQCPPPQCVMLPLRSPCLLRRRGSVCSHVAAVVAASPCLPRCRVSACS